MVAWKEWGELMRDPESSINRTYSLNTEQERRWVSIDDLQVPGFENRVGGWGHLLRQGTVEKG